MDREPVIAADEDARTLTVTLSKAFYEKAAIFQSAYRFTGRCVVDIRPGEEGTVRVTLSPKEGSTEELRDMAREFQNEVVDQQLRLDLEKKYGRLREIIYEHAFAPIANLEERVRDAT